MLGTGAALVLANNSGKQSTALATSQAQAANAQVVAEMQAKNAAAASSTTKYALIGAGLAAVVLIGYLITRKG